MSSSISSLPKQQEIHVFVGSDNPIKVDAVAAAFEKVFENANMQTQGQKVSSGVNSQPIGFLEIIRGATNRMDGCFPKEPKEMTFSVGLENGMVKGADLSSFFRKEFSKDHWYDIGAVAITGYREGLKFSKTVFATPLQIPNTEKGMLPPDHADGIEKNLEKYRKVIMPLIEKNKDIYHVFSMGKVSRKGALCDATVKAIQEISKINISM